jgi:branched-chain amino acid transport system permease protein
LAAAILAALPLVGPPPFVLSAFTEIGIYALFAMSVNLLLGQIGLPSLGQAAFWGTGAYAAGVVAKNVAADLALTVLAAILLASLVALIVGPVAVRSRGGYFLMVTLALSQVGYVIAFRWTPVTGGSNGLAGVPAPTLLGVALGPSGLYVATVLVCAFGLWLMDGVRRSPFGQTLLGIRENEARMEALGYRTSLYKLAGFVLAGAYAGLAGGLFVAFNRFVSAGELAWSTSGLGLVMVIVGGAGTLLGPLVGAAVELLLRSALSSGSGVGERWQLVLGLLFVGLVLVGQGGLVGLGQRLWRLWRPARG